MTPATPPTTPAVAAMGTPARRPRLAGLAHHGRMVLLLAILIATVSNGLERAARDNARARQMDQLLERVRALEQRAHPPSSDVAAGTIVFEVIGANTPTGVPLFSVDQSGNAVWGTP